MGNIIGLLSTNYTGDRYGKLIEDRPVASIPFGGRYRLIDFPLSSMVNSGIDTVGVITPSNYRSLADHLNMGREWGLNKKQGGLFMLPGAVHGFKDLHARFSLRDVIQNRQFFLRADEDNVLFCAANRVYNMDFRPAIAQHERSGAAVTLVYKQLQHAEDSTGLFLRIGPSGQVEGVSETATGEANCFLDCMLIRRKLILDFIECYQNLGYIDILDIVAANLGQIQVDSWQYTGYEHAVDDAKDYMKVSLDLLRPQVQAELFQSDRPVLTKTQDSPPAKYLPGAHVQNSLVAASCILAGTVENSILFRSVEIGEGAVVRNSVLMQHCIISPGAVVENVICDKYVTISPDVKLSGSEKNPFLIGKQQTL
jgi:glucose-1-phosphate adenylyltransferase